MCGYNQKALPPQLTIAVAVESIAAALSIGLLIGAQREALGESGLPGLRDFLLIALAGGVCGVLGNPWLAAAALLSIAAMTGISRYQGRAQRSGITTELAGIATFGLALLAASPQFTFGKPLAIGIAIVVAVFLEAKQRLHTLLRQTITEREFNATLAFAAVVLVIYPLLPAGRYGPYSFFSPRQVWMFVILISSISFIGYFFEKFLGREKGLYYTSVLGGLASTTAATLDFARQAREDPRNTFGLWRAFVIANTVQFPRAYLIVALVSADLARALVGPLAAMTLCGIVLGEILMRWPHKRLTELKVAPGNPFRILPALKFGALFTAIVFVSKAAAARAGTGAFYGTSLLGGLVDVATVIAPAADLLGAHRIPVAAAEVAVLLALASNAVLKIGVALLAGTMSFTLRVTGAFALWAAVGAAAWWIFKKV